MPHRGITDRQNNGEEVLDRKVDRNVVEAAREALEKLREV